MANQNQLGKGNVIKEWDPQTKIYLLTSPGSKDMRKTVGFKRSALGVFTFAFTSPEKLQAFVNYQKETGALGLVGKEVTAFWLTLEEYFSKPGNNELYIDPPVDFQADFGLPYLN